MSEFRPPIVDEVDHLLRNAQLRDELEPYFDESITRLNFADMSTPRENEFLASMLAWERAPVLPISQWFDPELRLPKPENLSDGELHRLLWETIRKLCEKRIVLDFTDHLSDRQLYCLIARDILPALEKKVERSETYLHWDCADVANDADIWLTYYATDDDRQRWADEMNNTLPPRREPPFPRALPRRPL